MGNCLLDNDHTSLIELTNESELKFYVCVFVINEEATYNQIRQNRKTYNHEEELDQVMVNMSNKV